MLRRSTWLLASICLIALSTSRVAAQHQTTNLVTIEQGTLPIILSAPHGGREAIPDVAERHGQGVRQFKSLSDFNTDKLVEHLAAEIEERLGKRPYLVIARFHRKYVDANRRSADAYESDNAKPSYESYHQSLATARKQVMERWGYGLLIDIHGQSSSPKVIFRGTQNGKTTTHLLGRFGPESLTGETSLFGQLARQGFTVIPEVGSSDQEHDSYDGGHIVWTYGSRTDGTVDAIQLEIGRELRSTKVLPVTADKLAEAIAAYAKDYLPQIARSSDSPAPPAHSKPIRVGVYVDVGTGASRNELLADLERFDGVEIRQLMAADIKSGALAEVDVLIHPGGSGGGQGRHLAEEGREKIRDFIADGGGFIGICAGAYLASADYPWSLHVLDAKVLDRKHWARGKGIVKLTLTDTGQDLLKSEMAELDILYAQGPLLAPADKPEIADYETIATFKTEISKNGAPQGVMRGTTAIARGKFGKGRVYCFSPHPELTDGLEGLLRLAIDDVVR